MSQSDREYGSDVIEEDIGLDARSARNDPRRLTGGGRVEDARSTAAPDSEPCSGGWMAEDDRDARREGLGKADAGVAGGHEDIGVEGVVSENEGNAEDLQTRGGKK